MKFPPACFATLLRIGLRVPGFVGPAGSLLGRSNQGCLFDPGLIRLCASGNDSQRQQRSTFEPQRSPSLKRHGFTHPASWPNYYCASDLDRKLRDESIDENVLDCPESLFIPVYKEKNLVKAFNENRNAFASIFLSFAEAEPLLKDPGSMIVSMGSHGGRKYYSVDVSHLNEEPELRDGSEFIQLRTVGGILAQDHDAGLLAAARGYSIWHRNCNYCFKCGSNDMKPHKAGTARKCGGCGESHYPRVDPSVIVLVISPAGSHVLLGRKAMWPRGQYSTLAGFTEIAESLEETVVREIAEESGVIVRKDSIKYASSQPWPFPRSLMIGYYAVAEGVGLPDVKVDEEEMEDVRWFSREEVRRALRGGSRESDIIKRTPGPSAIAHKLISGWIDAAGMS